MTVALTGTNFGPGTGVAVSATGVSVAGVTVIRETRFMASLIIATAASRAQDLSVNTTAGSRNTIAFQIKFR